MIKSLYILAISVVIASGQTPLSFTADSSHMGNNVIYRFYGTPQYYFAGTEFKKINTELVFDRVVNAWVQNRAPYYSEFPEYADGWFSFVSVYKGANIMLKSKPVAAHIEGKPSQDNRSIVYQNAFGDGVDLIVKAMQTGMLKEICVRSVKNTEEDLSFRFELDLPAGASIEDKYGEKKPQSFDFTGEEIIIGAAGKNVYFTP